MSDAVLWRRLTETDFNAMHGDASPRGRGGGAMHVALGVASNDFRVDDFLRAHGQRRIIVTAAPEPGTGTSAPLSFSSNPNRRGGEWLIRDQFSHRHPAWTAAAGFPVQFDRADPPYVMVFRVGREFHARFATANDLGSLSTDPVVRKMLSSPKGIGRASPDLLAAFRIPAQTLLERFEEQAETDEAEAFDPADIVDGRRRILAAVIRRLGQQAFRRKLMTA